MISLSTLFFPLLASLPGLNVEHAVGDVLLRLIVQIALILGLSRVMGVLFARMRQPQVVGEMIAGIMLGPSVLGAVWHHGYQTLFPGNSIELLNILSQLGVIFFLFLVGLEFDFELVRHRGRSTAVTALSSIFVPFVLGVAVTIFLAWRGLFPRDRLLPASLFMGASMSVTAFPVLARILTERNLHKTKLGAAAIACAAINDVAAWIILAFVVAVAHSSGGGAAVRTIGLTVGFGALVFLVVRPFLRRLELVYARQGRLSQNVVAVIFLLILVSSWSTELIGIHAMFGAFLLGVVMPKGTHFVRHLTEKIEDFTVVFLLPVFFAYTGLKTNLGLLASPTAWGYAALIVAAACAGKFAGAAGVAWLFGSSRRESLALGVLMNTRGLVELVILTIGLEFGVIDEKVFAMMVIMALVTTFMTTPLLHWVYPARLLEAAGAPLAEKAKAFSVLISVADPSSGGPLVQVAEALAGGGERRIYALHLRRPVDRSEYRSGLREAQQPATDESLRPLLAHAQKHQIPVEAITFVSRDVPADVARVARERDVDLVLIGFHKPVFGRAILGGTVHRILTATERDVAVFVDRGFLGARRILVPYLGGPHDTLAMQLAGRFARNVQAEVTILHVTAPKYSGMTPLNAKEAVERAFNDPTQPLPVQMRVIESDNPVEAVIQQASDYDLVVIGVAEEWGLESHLFGWRPERIAAGCPNSLLIVRQHASEPMEEAPELQPQTTTPAPQLT